MRKTPPLSKKQKDEILAILSVGCSRQTAARYVGCTPALIRKTAKEDAIFADGIRKAQDQAEILSMRCIAAAAKQDKYWKAAAWILERRNPEEFRLRGPGTFTPKQLKFIITQLSEIIVEEVKIPIYRKRLLERIDEFCKEYST
ncbi:MAG: hypothetical protein Q4D38_08105 [Planctomycetia bacterium]|nr:hypothetical protein [Planctomycetia bacterium]